MIMPIDQPPGAPPKIGKQVGIPFVKGQVANPLGAGAHNQELKKVKKLTQKEVAEVGQMILDGNVYQLRQLTNDPTVNALKATMAKIWLRAYDKGDVGSMEAILDRVVGKVAQKTELSGDLGIRGRYSEMSDADLKAEALAQAEALKALEHG